MSGGQRGTNDLSCRTGRSHTGPMKTPPTLRAKQQSNPRRRALLIGATGLLALATLRAARAQAEMRDATATLEALLDAMGGRSAWAELRGLAVLAVHHLAEQPAPFDNRIWLDFERPRLRIESNLLGLRRVRVLDGEQGWRQRGDEPTTALPPADVASEREWWASHVYRTISRLARRDPALAISLSDDGRLLVQESGAALAWLRVDRRGEPIAFGARETPPERGTQFGPLAPHGALRFPSFSINNQGRWRAIPSRFEADPALPEGLFAAPGGVRAAPR